MKLFKLIIGLTLLYSVMNAQVLNIEKDWNLLGATEDIHNLSIFNSACVEELFIYTEDKIWKGYPRDKTLTSLKEAQGFWAYAKSACSIDTKASVASDGVLDITDIILTKKSSNCRDYVRKYGSSVKDIKENKDFSGVFEVYLQGDKCIFKSNSIPNHDFNDASAKFATKVSTQSIEMEITSSPSFASEVTSFVLGDNGIMLNGVKLDILAAGCFGVGDGKIGCHDISLPWRYDPMSPQASFGTDKHNAHTQPSGAYHYHGSPEALFDKSGTIESPIIGFAIDGFPIFGSYFMKNGQITKATSSYKLKLGNRQSVNGVNPGGSYNGEFRDDYEYVNGLGDLDECNGMSINGVYGYYVTDSFPWVINCYKGVVSLINTSPPNGGQGGDKKGPKR